MRVIALLFALVAVAIATPAAGQPAGQPYPNKPLKLIVAYPPGGTSDLVGRALAQKLSDALGQPVVVENRGGANGMIGTDAVAKAAPDGYTLLVINSGPISVSNSLAKMPYDPQADLKPVSRIAESKLVLVTHPALGAKTVGELVALAKSRPGKLNAAIPAVGAVPHLLNELFKLRAGVTFANIPYKGSGPAAADLIGGQVDLMFVDLPAVLPFVKSGRLMALAVTSEKRSPALPDVPTMGEVGFPTVIGSPWHGLFVPARTPDDIVQRLNREAVAAVRSADMTERLAGFGTEVIGSSPDELAKFVADEIPKWSAVVRDAKIRGE